MPRLHGEPSPDDPGESPAASRMDAQRDGEWPTPQALPTGLPVVPVFDLSLLPVSLRGAVTDIAERMQAPPDFCAVAYLVVAASLVGRRVRIRPKANDDWTVTPNLWGAVIGPPSAMKSPSLSVPLGVLRRLEEDAAQVHADAMAAHERRQEAGEILAEGRRKDARKRAEAMAKAGTATLDAVADLITVDPLGAESLPVRRRFQTNDATVEKLGEVLKDNPHGVLVFRDELVGWLRGMEREGREQERAFYLEAFNGTSSFTFDRIARGTVEIPCAVVSLLGGIQPGPFMEYLGAAARGGSADDGLVQRFQVAVWPDAPSGFAYIDRAPDVAAIDRATAALQSLATLTPDGWATMDAPDAGWVRFDDEGQHLWADWYERHMRRTRDQDLAAVMSAHLGKVPKTLPTVALLLHLLDGGRSAVPAACVRTAIAWMEYLEAHARRIFHAAIHPDQQSAETLGRRLRRGDLKDGFTARDVTQRGWAGLTERALVDKVLAILCDHDWLRAEPVEHQHGGRPTVRYRINPLILSEPGT